MDQEEIDDDDFDDEPVDPGRDPESDYDNDDE